MSRARDLAFLRLLLTSGIDIYALMPLASSVFKRLFPSFSLSMIRVDDRCAPRAHYSEYFDETSHQLFASAGDHFTGQSDDPAAFGNLMRCAVPYGNLVDLPPGYLEGAIYQYFFSRNGIFHVLDVALRDAHGPIGILGIFREQKAPPFSRADVALVHELYPLLVHACVAPSVPSRHEEIDSAMLIASHDGALLWASPMARRWLEDASVSSERAALIERRVLPHACQMLCRSLHAHQSNSPARTGDLRAIPSLTLPVPGGQIRLRAYALAPQLDDSARDAHVGISIALEMNRKLQVIAALSRMQLSPQLQRLALALWSGVDSKAICSQLEISASTLKSYRKQLYAVLEVQSHAELTALLDRRSGKERFDMDKHTPRADASSV